MLEECIQKNFHDSYHSMTEKELLKKLDTSLEGISNSESKKRLLKYGFNELEKQKKKNLFQRFLLQFKDLMIFILIAASVISASVSHEILDSIIILIVVFINAILGVLQESKAEKSLDFLRKNVTLKANVLRKNILVNIDANQLVPGDIVLIESGNIVPADIRLIETKSLKIEEAALTGESQPSEKKKILLNTEYIPLGDRINMAYSTTNVTHGRGKGVVVNTGMNTQIGKIAKLLKNIDETQTPLKQNLNHLGKFISFFIILIATIVFFIKIFINNESWASGLLSSISLAVAAIPEGLPAIVTIILSLGTQVMASKNSIVRKLPAVESLGATDIICSDKTGTLTMNKMSVEKLYLNNQQYTVEDKTFSSNSMMLKIMSYANDTKISKSGMLIGDPTETALFQFCINKGFDIQQEIRKEPRVAELPFDSNRKLMTTVHKLNEHLFLIAVKGAPDILLKRSKKYLISGKVENLDSFHKRKIIDNNSQMAKNSLRILGVAYKYVTKFPEKISTEFLENELIFIGLVGMIDPERPEASNAIMNAKSAGIRTIMITGDHKDTAAAIAKRLNILKQNNFHTAILTGKELNTISEENLVKNIRNYSVYARVSPEHKLRIVQAWQSIGKIVAMTGDGVNDAPALKKADIGVGMGITGTEVAKGVSDIILSDDNFSSIVVAVKEGRKVFSNIQKAIQYLMSANLGEVLILLFASLFSWNSLLPVHLLWINLVTDTFPAIALGIEPAEEDLMLQKPRGRKTSFFSKKLITNIIYQGILEAIIVLFLYWSALKFPVQKDAFLINKDASTMMFASLGLMQLFHAFNIKSLHQSLFKIKNFKNLSFNLAIFFSFFLMIVVIITPGLNTVFRTSNLNFYQWTMTIISSISIIPIVEIVKMIGRKNKKS